MLEGKAVGTDLAYDEGVSSFLVPSHGLDNTAQGKRPNRNTEKKLEHVPECRARVAECLNYIMPSLFGRPRASEDGESKVTADENASQRGS